MNLAKYSMGVGDRFAQQGRAQIRAFLLAKEDGIDIVPVWNKSHREHVIVKSSPADVRREAEEAVKAVRWQGSYHVDADHIGLKNVDLFLEASDFFTLDVADSIGGAFSQETLNEFVQRHEARASSLTIPGIGRSFEIPRRELEAIVMKYLPATKEAGRIYRHILSAKGTEDFITEVSMDETDLPQTPVDLFFILAGLAEEGIPVQTIAPKFTGRFNKGVDYVGNVDQFTREFEEDLAVIDYAVQEFNLPSNLKLSVHSGSDKFSIYAPMREAIKKRNCGLHLKTAGTTWLEELIGLALAGGEGLVIAKEIYAAALKRFDELCGPYATVIDINRDLLPGAEAVAGWSGDKYAHTLRHDSSCPDYSPDFRQLLHVAYKIAAEMGDRYLKALKRYEDVVAENVVENLYERHMKPLFS